MLNIFSKWKQQLTDYIDVRIRLYKLSLIERTASVLSFFAFLFIALVIGSLILIFVGFLLAECFTRLCDSRIWGFFITSVIYLLLFWGIYASRKAIIRKFSDAFINILSEDDDEETTKKS